MLGGCKTKMKNKSLEVINFKDAQWKESKKDFIIPKWICRIIGYLPDNEFTIFYKLFQISNFVFIFILFVFEIAKLVQYLRSPEDTVTESILLFSYVLFGVDSAIKLQTTIRHRNEFYRIMKALDVAVESSQKRLSKEFLSFSSFEKKWKMSNNGTIIGLVVGTFIFVFGPITRSLHKYILTGEMNYELPMTVLYPIDITQYAVLFALAYIHQSLVVVLNCTSQLFPKRLTASIVTKMCICFEDIAFRLKKIQIRDTNSTEYKRSIKEIVQDHQLILRLVNDLNKICGYGYLFFIICGAASMCFAGFFVIIKSELLPSLMIFPFMALVIMEMFIICLFGEMLRDANGKIGVAAYNCGWRYSGSQSRKDLLIIMIRANSQCGLKAGEFYQLNFETFLNVVTFSYQILACLLKISSR